MCTRCFGDSRQDQVIIFGPEGAGKTTFLYRIKIKYWKQPDISREMRQIYESKGKKQEGKQDPKNWKDPGYHYEEIAYGRQGNVKTLGMWDVPGTEVMESLWPMFYRYINVSGIIFIVDGREEDDMKKIRAQRQLARLMNEDELRMCAFILIINDKQEGKSPLEPKKRDELIETICVVKDRDFERDLRNDKRLLTDPVPCEDITDAWKDGMGLLWGRITKHITDVYDSIGPGAPK